MSLTITSSSADPNMTLTALITDAIVVHNGSREAQLCQLYMVTVDKSDGRQAVKEAKWVEGGTE